MVICYETFTGLISGNILLDLNKFELYNCIVKYQLSFFMKKSVGSSSPVYFKKEDIVSGFLFQKWKLYFNSILLCFKRACNCHRPDISVRNGSFIPSLVSILSVIFLPTYYLKINHYLNRFL